MNSLFLVPKINLLDFIKTNLHNFSPGHFPLKALYLPSIFTGLLYHQLPYAVPCPVLRSCPKTLSVESRPRVIKTQYFISALFQFLSQQAFLSLPGHSPLLPCANKILLARYILLQYTGTNSITIIVTINCLALYAREYGTRSLIDDTGMQPFVSCNCCSFRYGCSPIHDMPLFF